MRLASAVVGLLATCAALLGVEALAAPPAAVRLDPTAPGRPGRAEPGSGSCGQVLMKATHERDGYAWQYGGVIPPDCGAFAECYSGDVQVCSAIFKLTQVGFYNGQTMDVFVWDDDDGIPGAVRCFRPHLDPGPIAYYPTLSTHVFALEGCCVAGNWWVGGWPNWPGQIAGWLFCEDLDGPGGCPLTKVAPGIGFPTGWQNVSVGWGPTQAMWIGAEVVPCLPVPSESATWGKVKRLFR